MANASVVASSNATCSGYIDQRLFDLGCLGPALAIILILAFLKRRESFMLDHCNGYPGLVIAISFLGNFKNRFTIAATFGATASTCLILLLNPQASFFPTGGPGWLKFIQGIVSVIVYGILFYPLFACVTTNYKLVGSLMGFLYAAIRFSFQLVLYFQCGKLYNAEVRHLRYRAVLSVLPVLLCLLFITIRFAVLLCVEVKHHWSAGSMRGDCRASDTIDKCFAGKLEMEHINRLLNSGRNRPAVTEVKWYLRLLYCIYQPRPDFKFSTHFISTLVVAGMALFQVTVILLISTDRLRRLYRQVCSGSQTRTLFCEIQFLLMGSLEESVVACSAISAILLLHFMKCHRDHIIQMYRGENTFCHDVSVSPRKLVGRSLRFSGYQIAYTLVGYFILILPLWLVCAILGFLFKYAERLPPEILDALTEAGIAFLPTIGTAIFLWLFQYFLAFFVFCDRDFPNITITVDNRQLFSIMSYFFFFYNILLGFFSSFLRILKGILLGVLFLPRIDRTCLMRGFQTWDTAFVAYLGFVNVLVAHSHPVMLAFCQLLIDRNKDLGLEGSLPQVHSLRRSASREEERAALLVDARPVLTCNVVNRQPRIARFSQRAVNRWLVAVMLLRNPSLIKYRKQGVARPFLTLRSVNSEDSALV
ncbi:stimulated by retinoic acid gene 6 protein-like isoform X2 [Montipora capricornis]|uniref:stimulated by retinoic acid gene 6 protein-like isoform X2 n=1 Tax=Montipora capricornis TaxID=246305 RepID=UPI0035F140D4